MGPRDALSVHFCAMWGYMEQRPRIEEGEVEKSRTRSWTAVLTDCRMPSDMQTPSGYLVHQLVTSMEEAFEVQGEDLNRDLDDFLFMLRENGVLAPDFEL